MATLDALNKTQLELLKRYDGSFKKLEDKANVLKHEWQKIADSAKKQIDTTNRLVNEKVEWADREVWNAINNIPIINLFSNPELSTDDDGNVKGLTVGYRAAIKTFKMDVENDTGGAWWQAGGRRLKITIEANDDADGINCCGNWYLALRLNNILTSIPTNATGIPLTYSFDYKILSKTSNKSIIKIGWEVSKTLNSDVSSEWKKAHMVYTHPAQRGYFISFYPKEKNARMEILLKNIVIAPGVVGDKFSNYTIGV